jgi:hypothetical protein
MQSESVEHWRFAREKRRKLAKFPINENKETAKEQAKIYLVCSSSLGMILATWSSSVYLGFSKKKKS